MFNQDEIFNLDINKYWREGVMGVTIVIGILITFFGIWQLSSGPKEIITSVLASSNEPTREEIVVEIAGAVKKPGTYVVGEGSRVGDLLDLAGGFTINADKSFVALELNLAHMLSDEEKIYVHYIGENDQPKSESKKNDIGKISINNASQSELENLVGVGEKRAQEIISNRPYQSIDELVSKNVISATVLENNKEILKL